MEKAINFPDMQLPETERLFFRPFSVDDAGWFYELNTDPEVMRFVPDVPFDTVQQSATFLEGYIEKHYAKNGFGRVAVIRKSDGAVLGWNGLKIDYEPGAVVLGYRFFRKYWGMGYATESSQAFLDWGHNFHGFPKILAWVMPQNKASLRIMEKLGFESLGPELWEGGTWVRFVHGLEQKAN